MAETAPARTAAASSSHPVLTASQRRLVMLCVQANWFVPVSSSCATVGAPQNSPGSSGTAAVATTSVVKAGLLRDRSSRQAAACAVFVHPVEGGVPYPRRVQPGDQQHDGQRGEQRGGERALVAVLAPGDPGHRSPPTADRREAPGPVPWPGLVLAHVAEHDLLQVRFFDGPGGIDHRAVQPDQQRGLPRGGVLPHDGVRPRDRRRVLARADQDPVLARAPSRCRRTAAPGRRPAGSGDRRPARCPRSGARTARWSGPRPPPPRPAWRGSSAWPAGRARRAARRAAAASAAWPA